MNEMCKIINPCICKNCGNEMLFFESRSGRLIDYTAIFNNGNTLPEIKKILNNRSIRFIKCVVCGKPSKELVIWGIQY